MEWSSSENEDDSDHAIAFITFITNQAEDHDAKMINGDIDDCTVSVHSYS